MTIGRLSPLCAFLLIGGACTKPAPAPMMDSAAVAAAHTGVAMMDPEVRLAAGMTLALRSHPEMKDSMLTAYRITQAGLDSLRARIAADTAKQAAYDRLVATSPARTTQH